MVQKWSRFHPVAIVPSSKFVVNNRPIIFTLLYQTVNATNKPGGAAPKRIVTVSPNNERGFEQQLNVVEDALLERWGIEIGRTDWLIHAKPLIGRKLQYTRFGKHSRMCVFVPTR